VVVTLQPLRTGKKEEVAAPGVVVVHMIKEQEEDGIRERPGIKDKDNMGVPVLVALMALRELLGVKVAKVRQDMEEVVMVEVAGLIKAQVMAVDMDQAVREDLGVKVEAGIREE
jgi:hypothetical protein